MTVKGQTNRIHTDMKEEQARGIANDIVNQLEDVGLINSTNAQWAEDLTTERLLINLKDT